MCGYGFDVSSHAGTAGRVEAGDGQHNRWRGRHIGLNVTAIVRQTKQKFVQLLKK
jgi:hypothetical protein